MKFEPDLPLAVINILLLVFSAGMLAVAAIARPLFLIPAGIFLLLILLFMIIFGRKLKNSIAGYLMGESFEAGETRYSLDGMSQPAMLVSKRCVLWYNNLFLTQLLGGQEHVLEPAGRLVAGIDLEQCRTEEGQKLEAAGRIWRIHATRGDKNALTFVMLTDVTEAERKAAELEASRPVCLLLEVDGYDTVTEELRESERARLMEQVNRLLEDFVSSCRGCLTRISSSRYMAVFEERYLQETEKRKFDILDKMRALDNNRGVTLSIGVGRGGESLQQVQEWARQGLSMALGRGGDQAAVKGPEGFRFYGGVSRSVEKQSKVRSRIVAAALCEEIKKSDSVIVMGHSMGDLDSLGSSLGLLHICQCCNVPAVIAVRRRATLAGSLLNAFEEAGLSDSFMEPEALLDTITENTLLVVTDTCLVGRLESRDIYDRCRRVAVIDHHRRAVGAIENAEVWYQEPYASSACELVSEMLQYVGTKEQRPSPLEAEALLSGIMLDTRNFALQTGVRTFEAAAWLRRLGAQTENVKKLFSSSLTVYNAKARLVGAAYVYRSCAISISGDISAEAASLAVPQAANDLLGIEGVQASIVAVRQGDRVNISARSMGAVNVQVILEALGGGGHLTMAGAQLKNTGLAEAEKKIRGAIDAYFEAPEKIENA